jgi:protein-tyrosine phosphatase
VNEVPLDLSDLRVVGVPGRVTLTAVPNAPGALVALRARHGTDVLVSLLPSDERARLGVPDLPARVRAAGMDHRDFPVADMGVPADAAAWRALVHDVHVDVASGRHVTIHCRAGLGRSGLLAACLLVHLGLAPDAAIAHVRAHRPGAIETAEQVAYVRAFSLEPA